jgi:hypothetical protein
MPRRSGARPDSFPPPFTSGALSPPAVRPSISIPPSAPRRLGGIPPPTLSPFPVPSAAGARPPGGGGAVLTTRRCAHVILRPFPQAAAAVPLPSSSSSSLHPSKPTPRVLGGGPPRPPGPVAQSLRRVPVARPPRRTTPNPYTPPDRQIASPAVVSLGTSLRAETHPTHTHTHTAVPGAAPCSFSFALSAAVAPLWGPAPSLHSRWKGVINPRPSPFPPFSIPLRLHQPTPPPPVPLPPLPGWRALCRGGMWPRRPSTTPFLPGL